MRVATRTRRDLSESASILHTIACLSYLRFPLKHPSRGHDMTDPLSTLTHHCNPSAFRSSFQVPPPSCSHLPLHSRFSILLSGLIHITLPSSSYEAWVTGGRYGIIYADDVNTTGHHTTFPSGDETVLLGIPTADGKQPEHMVLHEGPCGWEDLVGL